jgi:polyisoprenoid-binding protein YceI
MMKRSLLLPAGALLLGLISLDVTPLAAQSAAAAFSIDPGHSSAEFKVQHLVVSNVRGTIPISAGTVTIPAGATLPESVNASLDATGLNTQNSDRDRDLRGPDWFDVSKYPTIVFKSTTVTPGPSGSFKVTGDLTLHGVTKSVVLDCSTVGKTVDGQGHPRIGYSASTTLDRRDYGMDVMRATPGGNLIAGTKISISLEIEVVER